MSRKLEAMVRGEDVSGPDYTVDPVLAARVVERVREAYERTAKRGTDEIGNILLDELFGGSWELERTKYTTHATLEAVMQHCGAAGFSLSRTYLANALQLAIFRHKLNEDSAFHDLGQSHRIEVVRLDSPKGMAPEKLKTFDSMKEIEKLSKEAKAGAFTVLTIRQKVRVLRGILKKHPTLAKSVSAAMKLFADDKGGLIHTDDDVKAMSAKQQAKMWTDFLTLERCIGSMRPVLLRSLPPELTGVEMTGEAKGQKEAEAEGAAGDGAVGEIEKGDDNEKENEGEGGDEEEDEEEDDDEGDEGDDEEEDEGDEGDDEEGDEEEDEGDDKQVAADGKDAATTTTPDAPVVALPAPSAPAPVVVPPAPVPVAAKPAQSAAPTKAPSASRCRDAAPAAACVTEVCSVPAGMEGVPRFIAELAKEQARHGVSQYVIIGRGPETFVEARAVAPAGLSIFELNLSLGIPTWRNLKKPRFDLEKPALVVSIGMSHQMVKSAAMPLLRSIALLAPGSTLAMTFKLGPEYVAPALREEYMQKMAESEAAGTRFECLFSPAEIVRIAGKAGFQETKHVPAAELARKYFGGRPEGLSTLKGDEILVASL